MIKKLATIGTAIALFSSTAISAFAANGITVAPFSYSALGLTGLYGGEFTPNQGPSAKANWVKVDGDWQLNLTKNADLWEVAASGAQLNGVAGLSTTGLTLGFTLETGSSCGAGAPRFNVRTTDGSLYFLGCVYGNVGGVVTFVPDVSYGGVVLPSGKTIESISLIQDEPGTAVIDDIIVNSVVVGGPGNTK